MVSTATQTTKPAQLPLGATVGLLTFDFYPSLGGQGRHTYDLWRHLRAAGVNARVLSWASNSLEGHTRTGRLLGKFGRGPGFSLAASLALRRWQEREGLGLVHANGGPGGVLLAGLRPRGKLLYTAHHTYAQQARYIPGQRWKRSLAALGAASYRSADAVTAVSPSTAASLRDELGIEDAKITVVPDGYDPDVFRRVDVVPVERSALFVGRLDARKGFRFLIEAWVHVARAMPSARLFVIGSGSLEGWARRYLAAAGCFDTVVFLGRQPEQELVAWYNRVSVVVVPSRFEGFGLTALEAMACGKRVVATDTDGLRDVVLDGVDGTLAPFGDGEGFAWAILHYLQRPTAIEPSRLAEIEQSYAWPRVAERYIETYRNLLNA